MTIHCARCGRLLKNPVYVAGIALGSTCAIAVAGARPKRARKAQAVQVLDERQRDLFEVAA